MSASPADDTAGDGDRISRRTLIRVLVGAAIGIPLLIEGLTFLGLVGNLFGADDPDSTATSTDATAAVSIGEELLPESTPTETLADAYVSVEDWVFTMVVSIENGSDRDYRLRVGAVTTEAGVQVAGGAQSRQLAPGETTTITGRWELPEGASPMSVTVEAVFRNGTATELTEQVVLGKIPVRG